MPYCNECKQECKGKWVDFGIGSYEFWGARGIDTRMAFVSECCEADVFEDEECKVPFNPDYDLYPDDDEPWYKEDESDERVEDMNEYFEEMEKEE